MIPNKDRDRRTINIYAPLSLLLIAYLVYDYSYTLSIILIATSMIPFILSFKKKK